MKTTINIKTREITNISDAQGFNVIKISATEAFKAEQRVRFCPCGSFQSALKAAGLEYDRTNLLCGGDSPYTGYIAVYTEQSCIEIFYLENGTLRVSRNGSPSHYTQIEVTSGHLWSINDYRRSLQEACERNFVKKETFDIIIDALNKGQLTFEASEAEKNDLKRWFGNAIFS